MKIGNINIGTKVKKSFFDMTHDISTTSDFGFCQPTLVQAVMPNSSFTLKSHSFVRLAPMPCPTFGRIKVKQDSVYVPMVDVFPAFNEFISGMSVNNPTSGTYIPQSVDYMKSNQLLDFMLYMCSSDVSSMNENTFAMSSKTLFSQMFTMSISSTFNPLTNKVEEQPFNILDLLESNPDDSLKILSLFYELVNNIQVTTDALFDLRYPAGENFVTLADFLGFDDVDKTKGLSCLSSSASVELLHSFFTPDIVSKYGDLTLINQNFFNLRVAFNGMPEQFKRFFNNPRSLDNADFSFEFIPSDFYAFDVDGVVNPYDNALSAYPYWLNFHLTPFGKRLMKIFIANGWNFGVNDFLCDMPKLYAYFKAWFDLYNVGRDMQWTDTSAHYLIHAFYDDPRTLGYKIYDDTDGPQYSEIDNLKQFLLDLSMCCYNMDADPMTVATRDPLLTKGGASVPFVGVTFPVGVEGSKYIYSGSSDGVGQYPMETVVISNPLDALSVTFLSRLYEYVNKESVLANKIADYMHVKYGVDIRSTAILKRSDFDVQISDIMGTVNNDQTALGEYAGKGIGAGDSPEIKFDVPQQGFLIQLTTVVPLGGYPQANTASQIDRYDFYTPEYDSLGMEVMKKSDIFAREGVINVFGDDESFGFRPRYFGLKYKNNVNNGGFSFRSQRASFLPYCLDRLFTEGHFKSSIYNLMGAERSTVTPVAPISLYPDEKLRSLGLVESFGNYNRIFYDTTGLSDNFIVHMIQDFKYYAPMKPISESYDTFDDEIDNASKGVDHA